MKLAFGGYLVTSYLQKHPIFWQWKMQNVGSTEEGLNKQLRGIVDGCMWLQHALLSFPSNCATFFPLHLVKLLAVFVQNH